MTDKMKILIAYDGSADADAALASLQRAGLPAHTEAIVFAVDEQWLPVPTSYWMMKTSYESTHPVAEEMQAGTARAAQSLRELFPQWEVRAEVHAGSPATMILSAAEAWHCDLIILGSRGHTGLVKVLLGSVSQKVLHHAHCSVRVARDPAVPLQETLKILVGIDGSPGAEAAARAVAARDWPAETEVILLSAIPPVPLVASSRAVMQVMQWYQEERTRVQSFTARLEQEFSAVGLNVRSLLVGGDAKTVLLEEAERLKADCLFVGSTGMNAFDRLWIGSVSSAIAERASCSVEVVRAHPKKKSK